MASCRQRRKLSKVFWGYLSQAVCCVALSIATSVQGETVSVYGVPFSIESIKEITPTQLLVSIGTEDHIIEREKLSSFVAETVLSQRNGFSLFSQEQLHTLIRNAVSANDIRVAAAAARAIFRFGDATDASSERFFESLVTLPVLPSFAKEIVEDAGPSTVSPKIIAMLLVSIGTQDIEWVRTNAERFFHAYAREIRGVLRRDFFDALRVQDVARAQSVSSTIGKFFGIEDEEKQRFDVLLVKLQGVSEGSFPETLASLTEGNPELRRELGPLYLDTIVNRAEELLEKGDIDQAIRTVVQIEFERRTPKVHELLSAALQRIDQASPLLEENQRVLEFLGKVIEKDSEIGNALFGALRSQVLFAARRGDVDRTGALLLALPSYFKDPNERNDDLRAAAALELFQHGAPVEAERILSRVQTSLGAMTKIRILWYRVGANPTGLLLFVASLIGISIFLWYLRSALGSRPSGKIYASFGTSSSSSGSEEEEEQPRTPFVTMRGRPTGLSAEYLEKLALFGLGGDATLKDIKTAYRTKIKDIHPDHNVRSSETHTNEFLEMKAAYERLLEIRQSMGLD